MPENPLAMLPVVMGGVRCRLLEDGVQFFEFEAFGFGDETDMNKLQGGVVREWCGLREDDKPAYYAPPRVPHESSETFKRIEVPGKGYGDDEVEEPVD